MTFIKAYKELWSSRFMKEPIANIKTFPSEKLEKEVNRSWKLERNLKSKSPTPVRYHHLTEAHNLLLGPPDREDLQLYIAKGNYLFIREGGYLHCMVYFRSGRLEQMWSSYELSINENEYTEIRGSSYVEGGREISVVIVNGYIFYFHLADGDNDLLATESSSPGSVTLIRQYHLTPVTASPFLEHGTADMRGEWIAFESSSGALLHNCRTNVTWFPQCPDHKEQQQRHWCALGASNVFFMGERLVLCFWHAEGMEQSKTLALYLIPSNSDCESNQNHIASYEPDSNNNILIAAASTTLNNSLLYISPFIPSGDVLSANDIECCAREGNKSTFPLHFISLSDLGHRLATCIVSVQLSIQSSSLQLQGHVFRMIDEDDDPYLLLEVVIECKPILVDLPDEYGPPRLYLYRLDDSKIQQFMDTILQSRLIDPNASTEARISRCGSAIDLRPGLKKVWAKMKSGMRRVLEVHLDVASGRLFLTCSDGIRVFDYV